MKILFFSPHAYWAVHALPEALVAENLSLLGHEIVVVNCDGLYRKNCVCMPLVEMNDLSRKENTCRICKSYRDEINDEFKFRHVYVDKYVDADLIDRVNTIVETATPGNYLGIEIDGIPVARYALYEFVLNHKLSSTDIPAEHWSEYLENLRNALLTCHAIKSLMRSEMPDRVTTYNSLYGVNRVVCAVADVFRVPHFTLHAGSHHQKRIQQMTIFKGVESSVLVNQNPALKLFRNAPLNSQQIATVNAHVSQLFDATSLWVYTVKSKRISSEQLRLKLGITKSQKVLLAIMRSNDERFGLELAGVHLFTANPVFRSQYEWLDWLAKFAAENPSYYIIFRVHPREYPNKRENKLSQNAVRFEGYVRSMHFPSNLKINTPEDNLSLHDLLKVTDVVLNGTSSAGLEACLFGIPVVGMSERIYAFDPELQVEAQDVRDYALKIKEALQNGLDFERVVGAYRWLNYVFSEVCIDISDGYASEISPARRILNFSLSVLRRVGLHSSPTSPLGYVSGRARPLINADRLSFAILNDEDSHIGAFPPPRKNLDADLEMSQISQHYVRMMKKVSANVDREFEHRVEQCLANCSSRALSLAS